MFSLNLNCLLNEIFLMFEQMQRKKEYQKKIINVNERMNFMYIFHIFMEKA